MLGTARDPALLRHASLIAGFVVLLAGVGCGKLAGLDEYGVRQCSAGEIEDPPGVCIPVPDCAENELPVAGGGCEPIGVPDDGCGVHFEPDRDAPGGCRPRLPDCQGGPLLGSLGVDECAFPSGCGERPTAFPDRTVWVRADATEPPDGTRDRPYKTITDAIAATESGWRLHILSGQYLENVRIPHQLELIGICSRDTKIAGTDPTRPVIDIGPDADRSLVDHLAVLAASASAGIRVDGAEGVSITAVSVTDSAGPGITFEDTQGAAGGEVENTVVQKATGVGIAAYGVSSLTLTDVRVVETRTLSSGDQGYGIGIFPSAVLLEAAAAPATPASPQHRSTGVSIFATIVQGGFDAGLLIEGSDVNVDRTFITGVQPQRDGLGRGVVVRRRLLGTVAATAMIKRSVIADVHDAGVRVEDAEVTIENTTIRGVGTGRPAGAPPCYGNGVRVRNNRWLPPEEIAAPRVSILNSLIQDTRESAVHVEGAPALIERTIVRGTMRDACEQFGDGISAYSYDFSPASVELRSSRIEAGPRAGVVSFGASVSLEGAVIDGCGEQGTLIGNDDARITVAEASPCRCNGRWSRCEASAPELEPALIGFGGCDPETEHCGDVCFTDLINTFAGIRRDLPNVSTWIHARDDVASVVSGVDGCYLGAVPPGFRGRATSALRDGALGPYTPTIGSPSNAGPGSRVSGDLSLVLELAGKTLQTNQIFRDDDPDFRNAIFVSVQVCKPPAEALLERGTEVCARKGVEGVRLELVGAIPPHDRAYYISSENSFTQLTETGITVNGSGYFYNVPPGEYVVRLLPPDRTPTPTLECELDPHGIGWTFGVPVEGERNAYRVRVEPGLNNFAVRAFCTLK